MALSSLAGPTMAAGRRIPGDKKQPEFLPGYDGTVLIPGVGRVVVPPKGKKIDPFNYNPITGKSGSGTGIIGPFDGFIGAGSGNVLGGYNNAPVFSGPVGTGVPNPEDCAGGSLPPPSRR
ncbi:unnamed protein product [Cuscuta campestris]|uniref:Cell wall protein n=1 Tax=Cuscuta campestris TaxID=132261 RepID=A0A484M3C1_9ASTE|nr:unnamed protein product [Cuscuta campestris]